MMSDNIVLMNDIILAIISGIIGAVMGSFVGAQVWRLRARHVADDKNSGEPYDNAEYNKLKDLTSRELKDDRSMCLSCREPLRWIDMIPVLSWAALRGKCRKCHAPIGRTEFLLELGLGAIFVLSVLLWPGSLGEPLEIVKLVVWLAALIPLAINFVYDLRWMSLISYCNWAIIALGLLYAGVSVIQGGSDWLPALISVAISVGILGGLYGFLWVVSKGRWVGEGDIYLGAGLGLFMADWKLALVGLFLANLIGTIIVLPGMISGKLARKTQVPFGPLLIVGCLLSWFTGDLLIDWYQSLLMIG